MTRTSPRLRTGRVYRTKDLLPWSANPGRLANWLVADGMLRKLGRGLYYRPRTSRFGDVPPTERELVRAFLGSANFVFSGSDKWNALGLGSTGVAATRLVYNHGRTTEAELDGRQFRFRRVRFPKSPSPEWYVVDLFENAGLAGVDRNDLASNLSQAVAQNRFDPDRLRAMAAQYGSRSTQQEVEGALG